MNAYSIGAESPRWWWPPAAAGAAGLAAIVAILVLPASGSSSPGVTTPQHAPAPSEDAWFSGVDPGVGRPCFLARSGVDGALDHPWCGRLPARAPWTSPDDRRPGLDSRP